MFLNDLSLAKRKKKGRRRRRNINQEWKTKNYVCYIKLLILVRNVVYPQNLIYATAVSQFFVINSFHCSPGKVGRMA